MSNTETAAQETTTKPAPSLSAETQSAIQSKFGNRSVSLSAMADSLASGGGAAAGGAMAKGAPKSAADVAADGFAGGGGAVPHKEEMEASFGTSFGGVKAHTDGAAQKSNKDMGSNAMAAGQNVSFSTASPDKGLVAHELTHTLQNNHRGPAASGAAGAGIDASGEGEAEAVQAAVNSGKPASSALSAGTKANAAAQKGGAGPAAAAGGPSLSKKHAPSLEGDGPKFGAGITFTPEGLETSGQYTIWSKSVEIPIAAVPGLNAMIEPQVVVKGKVGNETSKNKATGKEEEKQKFSLGVEGGVGVGLSYGVPDLCSVYGVTEASASGGFEFTKTGKDWDLEGSIGLSSVFAVGVKIAGGILDERFEFGKCEIGKLTGIKFENGKFMRDKLGWEWGEKPKQFFETMKKVVEKAKQLASMAADAAKKVYNGAKSAGKKVLQGASDAASWLTSW